MSMIGNFVAISNAQLQGFLANPDSVTDFLYSDDTGEPAGHMHIDKAWDGIHYLLTGEVEQGPPPWSQVVMGGTEIGEDAGGYGPARYLRPEQVREVAEALPKLPRDQLAQRYAPEEMEQAGVYPSIWMHDGEEALNYLLDKYDALVEFYQQAAAKQCAVLQYLN